MESKLKQRRLELGLTLEEVGEICGVGKSTVRKWENGMINDIGRSKIVALAKALNVSPLFILESDNIEINLTPEENRLLYYYNKMNDIGKKKTLENAADLSKLYGVDYIYNDGKNNFVIEMQKNNVLKAAHNDAATNQEELEKMNQDLEDLND